MEYIKKTIEALIIVFFGVFQKIQPLNDFKSGDYWIRIGQTDDSKSWAYSGVFKFKGNGTAQPYHLACKLLYFFSLCYLVSFKLTNTAFLFRFKLFLANSAAAAAATSGSSASGKASSSSSASQAAQSNDESAAMQLNVQGKTLAAVAGGAVAAAIALAL